MQINNERSISSALAHNVKLRSKRGDFIVAGWVCILVGIFFFVAAAKSSYESWLFQNHEVSTTTAEYIAERSDQVGATILYQALPIVDDLSEVFNVEWGIANLLVNDN